MSKIKNILIFAVAGAVLVGIYIFFIKGSKEQTGLVSTPGSVPTSGDSSSIGSTNNAVSNQKALDSKDFLTILLNVKNIKLDDSIFSDPAFSTLLDYSIVLVPDGTEGRVNPFAPIGSDVVKLTSPDNIKPVEPDNTSTSTPSVKPSPSKNTKPSASNNLKPKN